MALLPVRFFGDVLVTPRVTPGAIEFTLQESMKYARQKKCSREMFP